MSKFALMWSLRKSYSSKVGYSSSLHRRLTSYKHVVSMYSKLFDFPLASMRESSTWKEMLISSSSRSSEKGQFHHSITIIILSTSIGSHHSVKQVPFPLGCGRGRGGSRRRVRLICEERSRRLHSSNSLILWGLIYDSCTTDEWVAQKELDNGRVARFDVVFVMLQNQFDLAIGYCTVTDKLNDLLWDGDLGVAIEYFNNVVRLQPHGNGGVERVGREFVLVDKGRASERG